MVLFREVSSFHCTPLTLCLATQGEPQAPAHDPQSAQLQASLDRERELLKRYEDLFQFLNYHTKESHVRIYFRKEYIL